MSAAHSHAEPEVKSPKGISATHSAYLAGGEESSSARNALKPQIKKLKSLLIILSVILILLNSWRSWRTEHPDTLDELASKQSQSAPSMESKTPAWFSKEEVVILSKDEVSKPIRVTGDRCIRAWGDNPDGNAFKTEVRGVNDSEWLEWGEFTKRKAEGTLSFKDFGWIRFTGNESNAKVTYGFWLPNQCS